MVGPRLTGSDAVEAFQHGLLDLIGSSIGIRMEPQRISRAPHGIDRYRVAIREAQRAPQTSNDPIETVVADGSRSPTTLEDLIAGDDATCFVTQFYEKLHDERLGQETPTAALDRAGARPDPN